MILIVDHYDSFVHNLARYFEKLGHDTTTVRCDTLTSTSITHTPPEAIILSPGPRAPSDTPQTIDLIKKAYRTIPILGVCLGHQCIAEAFGGKTIKANVPMHGKESAIHHHDPLFENTPTPFPAGRYHSLIADISNSNDLTPIAHSDDGTLMGFKHKNYPTYGLQFHPESILTDQGLTLLKNFMGIAQQWNKKSGSTNSL